MARWLPGLVSDPPLDPSAEEGRRLLREELGREPTPTDYARANLHRVRTAFSQAGILARRGLRRGKT